MQLIGMLDSPFVRRVAVSMQLLGLEFEHRALSVFGDFEAFAAINPVVKAPTLRTDTGVVICDSGVILDHVARIASAGGGAVRLEPDGIAAHARAQRLVGLALAASEKAVQLVYEERLRPAERRHGPWVERVQRQLAAALAAVEADLAGAGEPSPWLFGAAPMQADVSLAVAWRFVRETRPRLADPAAHPHLARLSDAAEATAAFRAWPFG